MVLVVFDYAASDLAASDTASFSFSKHSDLSLRAVDSFTRMSHYEVKCFAAFVGPFSAACFSIYLLLAEVWTCCIFHKDLSLLQITVH